MMAGGTPSMAVPSPTPLHDRDQWAKSIDFTYTLINLVVGFSNVCQFPYLVYDNGGLVFILVYAFLIAIVGVPLLYLEFFLGQFSGSPMPNAFGGFPMAKGIGWTMVYMGALLAIFNTPITAYSFIYLTDCFSERLPWKWCPGNGSGAADFAGNVTTPGVGAGENVSSVSCYEIAQYQYPCARVNSTLARRYRSRNYTGPEAVSVPDAIGGPVVVVPLAEYVALRNACIHGNLSSQEYYLRKEVLNLTSTIAELGAIQPRVALSMAICWFLGFLITIKGHRSLAIVSMVSVYAKVALLLSLSIAALTLSGALHGATTCLKPDLLKLFKIQTWDKAASLLFYTVGLSLGTTTCFASYNNFQADILRYSVMMPLADFGYSLLSTVFVFSLYGHVAQSYDVEVSDVVTTGCVQYGFITFPESVSSRYEGRLWCSAFYTLLFLLNNSQMVIMEGVLGTVKDIYPGLRRRVPLVALLACSAGFLISLPTAYQGGYYLTDLVYTILSSDLIPWIGFAQLVTVVYAYGTDKLLGDITFMFERPPPRYLPFCWRYICPVALAGMGLYTHTVARDPTARTAQQEFIDWSTVYQVVIMAVAVVLIGAFVASELGKHKNDLYAALQPEPTYGPRGRADFLRYQMCQANRNALPSSLPAEHRREMLDMAAPSPVPADAKTPVSATGGLTSPAPVEKPEIVQVAATAIADVSPGTDSARQISNGKKTPRPEKSNTGLKDSVSTKGTNRQDSKRRKRR